MIVCLCRGLSDADIRATMAAGADTLPEIGDACGAGTDCRMCCECLVTMLAERAAGAATCAPGERRLAGSDR
jgi:bacterioferritin-associated ferredoxin